MQQLNTEKKRIIKSLSKKVWWSSIGIGKNEMGELILIVSVFPEGEQEAHQKLSRMKPPLTTTILVKTVEPVRILPIP